MTMVIFKEDVKLLFRFATDRAVDAVGVRASLGLGTDVILGEIRLRNASLANRKFRSVNRGNLMRTHEVAALLGSACTHVKAPQNPCGVCFVRLYMA
ncbi:MAG TPA: hypothetical protein VGB15_20835, partial [Longimicrobium sp.]